MLWNIDGQEIEILTKADGMIEVLHWEESRKAVYLPAHLSKEEAIWSLRNLLEKTNTIKSAIKMGSMTLFDRRWPVGYDVGLKDPFIKDGIIYCPLKGEQLSAAAEKTIQERLFSQWVTYCVGRWEEHFDQLVPQITFRQLKKSTFTIRRGEGILCFDKGLLRFQQELIAYTVFLAICRYFSVHLATVDSLRNKHFPSARLYDKIIAYAYNSNDQLND